MRRWAFILTLAFAAPAAAHEPLTDDDLLTLAQALVGEADWHEPDHAAIAWVLKKRWELYLRTHDWLDFGAFVKLYCSPLKTDSPRSRAIQALTWGPSSGKWGGERWLKVQRFVERWADGRVQDPCPSAMQWGGTMDRPHGHWYPVSCGRTNNIFYGVHRREQQDG